MARGQFDFLPSSSAHPSIDFGLCISFRVDTVTAVVNGCGIFPCFTLQMPICISVPEEEIRVAEEKFEESKELCYSSMLNLIESDVSSLAHNWLLFNVQKHDEN